MPIYWGLIVEIGYRGENIFQHQNLMQFLKRKSNYDDKYGWIYVLPCKSNR